jgi:hypothetical protein
MFWFVLITLMVPYVEGPDEEEDEARPAKDQLLINAFAVHVNLKSPVTNQDLRIPLSRNLLTVGARNRFTAISS